MRLHIVLPTKISVACRCMEEICEALVYAGRDLGHDVTSSEDQVRDRTNVLLVPSVYVNHGIAILPGSILYNLEQVYAGSHNFTPPVLDAFRHFTVWDYDEANIAKLTQMGGVRAKHVPVGTHPALFRMEQNIVEDVDVAFAGAINPRRANVLDAIRKTGLRVEIVNAYGPARDAIYARSKICLNVHYYEAKIFESVRVSYLLQNRRCVVTEDSLGGGDAPYASGMITTSYENLASVCKEVASDRKRREDTKRAALAAASRRRMVTSLRPILGEMPRAEREAFPSSLAPDIASSKTIAYVGGARLSELLDLAPRESAVVTDHPSPKEHWEKAVAEGQEKLPVYTAPEVLSSLGPFDLVVLDPGERRPPNAAAPGTTVAALGTSDPYVFETLLSFASEKGASVYPHPDGEDVSIVRLSGGQRKPLGKPVPRKPKPWNEKLEILEAPPPFPEAADLFRWAVEDRFANVDRGPLLERLYEEAKGAKRVADFGTGQGSTLRALLLGGATYAYACDIMNVLPMIAEVQARTSWGHIEYVPHDLRTLGPLPAIDLLCLDTRLTCDDIYQTLERHAASAKKVIIMGTRRYATIGEDGRGFGVWHAVSGFCTSRKWKVLFQDASGIGMTAIAR
jgi:hypothetical protein